MPALTSTNSGGGMRQPMRMHALAVAVCPTPSSASTSSSAPECTAQMLGIPPIANVPGLTPLQIPGYEPADLQSAYNLPSRTAGYGRTIAIVIPNDHPHAELDLAVYRAMFGLPPCTSLNGCFHRYGQDGSSKLAPQVDQSWSFEADIDLQMASAVCPNCKLDLIEATNDDPTLLATAIQTAAKKLGADVVSNSWVAHEDPSETKLETAMTGLGAAIVAASGDSGYSASWPGAARSVITVGGTTLLPDNSARGWSETVWTGSGSGCSAYIPKPLWQTDSGCSKRTLNDVAAVADPQTGVAVFDSVIPGSLLGGWVVAGGTSVATPIVAGTIALAGNGRTTMSAGASYIYASSAFLNAVTSGSNGQCASYLCYAGHGYNGPAGFGSPNGTLAF